MDFFEEAISKNSIVLTLKTKSIPGKSKLIHIKGERKMKKLLSILLTITILATLVGCGSKTEISRGKIEGDVYTNELLGFEFTKPESWDYSNDKEIADMLNIAADSLLNDNLKDTLEKNPGIYDMMVVDSVTNTNINVMYENLRKTLSKNIGEEKYFELVKKQLAEVTLMTYTFPEELETVNLGDTEFTKCICKATVNGVTMTQIYYLHNLDGYMTSIIVTIPRGYTVSDIEKMFK